MGILILIFTYFLMYYIWFISVNSNDEYIDGSNIVRNVDESVAKEKLGVGLMDNLIEEEKSRY